MFGFQIDADILKLKFRRISKFFSFKQFEFDYIFKNISYCLTYPTGFQPQ